MLYTPLDLDNPVLIWLWDYVNLTDDLVPIRGARSTFTYDLPFFPYGREHPMEETRDLLDTPAPSRLAASYDAAGNFVMIGDSFSGQHGQDLRIAMEAIGFDHGRRALDSQHGRSRGRSLDHLPALRRGRPSFIGPKKDVYFSVLL